MQVNFEVGWISVWPYSVVDYYHAPWSSIIIDVFGLPMVFCAAFLVYWVVTKVRLLILLKKIIKKRKPLLEKSFKIQRKSVAKTGNLEVYSSKSRPHEEVEELSPSSIVPSII